MPIDHYVRFRSEEYISEVSAVLRRAADTSRPYFNIADYLTRLIHNRMGTKDQINFDKYSREYPDPDSHASVTFSPLTLHTADDIWSKAAEHDPFSRFVLAHELGHISLHRHDELGYSGDPSRRIRFADKEHSAEWQADTFALHFLMPDFLISKLRTPDVIEAACLVPLHWARERVNIFNQKKTTLSPKFTGDYCNNCGNFTLERCSTQEKCTTCGNKDPLK